MQLISALVWAILTAGIFLLHIRFLPGDGESGATMLMSAVRALPMVMWGALVGTIILAGVCGYFTWNTTAALIDGGKLLCSYLVLAAAALSDLRSRMIPNLFPLALVAFRLIFLGVEIATGREGWVPLVVSGLIGGLVLFGALALLSHVTKGGVGFGDAKLFGALGFMYGVYGVFATIFLALIVCSLFGIVLLVTRKGRWKDKLPFVPFTLCGYAASLLLAIY